MQHPGIAQILEPGGRRRGAERFLNGTTALERKPGRDGQDLPFGVTRGGSHASQALLARSSRRTVESATLRHSGTGLRAAMVLPLR